MVAYKDPQYLINDYKIKAKKSLGQNFLIDESIIDYIYKVIGNIENRDILEIGPGLGSLTRVILSKKPKKLLCIEKDLSFQKYLTELSAENDILDVQYNDALRINYDNILPEKYLIIANLPYNIASELIYQWIQNDHIDKVFLMIQKEVAERIVALPKTKDYGKLSVLAQLFCHCEILFDVPPEAFLPAPKVTSSFVLLHRRNKMMFDVDIAKLNKILSHLFNFRRKMLRKSLSAFVTDVDELCAKCDINPTMRPEELTLENLCNISNNII